MDCLTMDELFKLEGAAGYDLVLLGKSGDELDHVVLLAADTRALSREDVILLSAVRTVAYMHHFRGGDKRQRSFFRTHLNDYIRKMTDLLAELSDQEAELL